MAAGNVSDPSVYSKGTPLQAYLLPQDPYYSAIAPFLQLPFGKLLRPCHLAHTSAGGTKTWKTVQVKGSDLVTDRLTVANGGSG